MKAKYLVIPLSFMLGVFLISLFWSLVLQSKDLQVVMRFFTGILFGALCSIWWLAWD
jgi:hypothetical protein